MFFVVDRSRSHRDEIVAIVMLIELPVDFALV